MAIIYQHRRGDTNEIFYIGIGKTKMRAYSKFNRNKYWHNIVNKVGYQVDILEDQITWEEACNRERNLISEYGRKDLNIGSLVNMTDGGDGVVGRKVTEEWKQKLSDRGKGRVISEDTRRKMSEAKKGIPKSEEWKQQHSSRMKGKTHTEEAKQKVSMVRKGKSAWNKGKQMSDEYRAKLSKATMGHPGVKHTEETKRRISETLKNRKFK